jgi:hypothetical protein
MPLIFSNPTMPIADRLTKARVRVRTSRSMTWRSPAKVAEPVLPASHKMVNPARPAETIGVAGHVMRIDKDVRMDVDQPRSHQPAFDGDHAACLRGRQ